MTKLKGLLLTEGMHGMISQVEGLAKALDLDFIHEKIELNNFWKLFPPKLTPISRSVYKKVKHSDFDVIISCGRKSVIPSIHLKKNSNKKVINIHIQNPKVNFTNFDFIVAPEHDGIIGENVINTKGAIHYLSEQEIQANKDYLGSFIKKDKRKIRDKALVLIGFSGGFRRSELVDIEYEDLEFVSEGVKIFVKRSKTDQSGEGMTKAIPYFDNKKFCPVIALKNWIEIFDLKKGRIFNISDKSVALIIKKYANYAGLDSYRYAGHSLRSGFATSTAESGAEERNIMAMTCLLYTSPSPRDRG